MKKRIIIVGAGYTGLTAARKLLSQGYDVEVLEASAFAGGLAADFTINNEPLEKAYHHFFKTDTHLIDMANELGLRDKVEWHPSSMAIVYNKKVWPFTTPFDLLGFKPLSFINRIRAGVVVLFLQKYKNWRTFIRIPASTWMQKYSGNQVYEVIWKPLLVGKFGIKKYTSISMAWLWARVHIRAKSRDGAKEVLGYFNGGFKQITEALLDGVTSQGGKIHYGCMVKRLAKDAGEYTIETTDGRTFSGDVLLLTTPSDVAAKIFRTMDSKEVDTLKGYLAKAEQIQYVGAVCLVMSSTQSLSKLYWHNINDIEAPFLAFIQHTNLIDKARYGGEDVYYLATYVPSDHAYFSMSQEEIEQKWFAYLTEVFPSFDPAKITSKSLFKFAKAQHIVTTNYDELLTGFETPLEGVFVANYSQIFPEDRGTNFAIRDGGRVSEVIDTYLKSSDK